MAAHLVFLSHIHEEREVALHLKEALESEFGGFVDVFVSSDGTTIPAGANFLKRIEDGLVRCVAAIYLLSPQSVKRSWINFELGAVWVRNAISLGQGREEIPAIPACHSGTRPENLPAPLNNLNGIRANDSAQLELAFKAIQQAVGGKGSFRTDFDGLAQKIRDFEQKYTLGSAYEKLIQLAGIDKGNIIAFLDTVDKSIPLVVAIDFVENGALQQMHALASNELNGRIAVVAKTSKMVASDRGTFTGSEVELTLIKASEAFDFFNKIT